MATEVWIALAVAGGTAALILILLLFIYWIVGRSVRGEVGASMLPLLELTQHITVLVDQARKTEQVMRERLEEVNELKVALDGALEQMRAQAEEQREEFARFAAGRQAEVESAAEQARAQIEQTLDAVTRTESEAARLVEDLRCMHEEIQLEHEVRSVLSRITADQNRSANGAKLRFGRITTDSPFLDFVIRADGKSPRYLSLQIKALGESCPAEVLRREIERAAAIKSAMPESSMVTAIVVVNSLPDGSEDLNDLLSSEDAAGVDVVTIDELCAYVLDWAASRESS